MATTREALLAVGLEALDGIGYEATTVAGLCRAAGASNGSFFHHFGSKEGLAAVLYLDALQAYQAAMLAPLARRPEAAAGVRALVRRHLDWVVDQRAAARLLFERLRPEWLAQVRAGQQAANQDFIERIEAWRAPLVAAGALRDLPVMVFAGQVIGPAQLLCRAWLGGRTDEDPRRQAAALADCAVRAVVAAPDPKPSRRTR